VESVIGDKLEDLSILDFKNTFSLINIKIKLPYLCNIFRSIIILLNLQRMLMAVVQVVRKRNFMNVLEMFLCMDRKKLI